MTRRYIHTYTYTRRYRIVSATRAADGWKVGYETKTKTFATAETNAVMYYLYKIVKDTLFTESLLTYLPSRYLHLNKRVDVFKLLVGECTFSSSPLICLTVDVQCTTGDNGIASRHRPTADRH